jgi:hypothetical protein
VVVSGVVVLLGEEEDMDEMRVGTYGDHGGEVCWAAVAWSSS